MTVACFDLDGTLIKGDTFALYIRFLIRSGQVSRTWLPFLAFVYLLRRTRIISLPRAKQMMLAPLAGRTHTDLAQIARSFWTAELKSRLQPSALARLEWHRASGHGVMIATSSPDAYLAAIGEALGVDRVYGTPLIFRNDAFTGSLGSHLFGEAKCEVLAAVALGHPVTYGYADHHSDIPLLSAVTRAHAVHPTLRLRRVAQSRGWEIIE